MFSWIRLIVALLGATGVAAVAAPAAAAAPPPNDASENATVVSALPFTDTLDTTEATIGPGDAAGSAACGLSAPLPKSVFYRYTAPVDQVVSIDVSQSTYAAAVGVLTGEPSACVTTFLGIGSLSAEAGRSYLIAVVDFGPTGAGGTLRLSMSVLEPPREPVVRLLRSGTVGRETHTVIVPVKYRCDGGHPAFLGVQVTQRRGWRTAEGFGNEFFVLCDGTRHVANVALFSAPGSVFKPGRAVATARISQFAFPFGEFMSEDGPQPICLRPMGRRIVAP
ncbi:MAG TPA: hypothetical protein VIX41_07430 [Acidimicrobiales bacterium]